MTKSLFNRRNFYLLVISLIVLSLTPASGYSDQFADLNTRIRAMEERHQREINDLRTQIKALEQRGKQESHITQGEDERIVNLEEEIEIIQEEQVSIINEINDRIDIDFYATLEYENFEKTDSVIDARNIEFLIKAQLTDRLRAGAEIEFERTAKTSGSSNRTGEVEVEQGWIEYVVDETFIPRFGVILVPFGKFNRDHFDPLRDLTDRPIVMRRVIPVTWAEAGVGFTGSLELGSGEGDSVFSNFAFNYAAYFVNGLTDEIKDTSLRDARGGFGNDNNDDKGLVGRLGFVPVDNLEIGFSFYTGDYDDRDNDTINGFDVDVEYEWDDFQFLGEYARFDLDSGVGADGMTPIPDFFQGFYLQTNYHFWPNFLNTTFFGRGFPNPLLTASLRYGMVRIDDDGDADTGDKIVNSAGPLV